MRARSDGIVSLFFYEEEQLFVKRLLVAVR